MFKITGTPQDGDIKFVANNLDSVLPDKTEVEKSHVLVPQSLLEDPNGEDTKA